MFLDRGVGRIGIAAPSGKICLGKSQTVVYVAQPTAVVFLKVSDIAYSSSQKPLSICMPRSFAHFNASICCMSVTSQSRFARRVFRLQPDHTHINIREHETMCNFFHSGSALPLLQEKLVTADRRGEFPYKKGHIDRSLLSAALYALHCYHIDHLCGDRHLMFCADITQFLLYAPRHRCARPSFRCR